MPINTAVPVESELWKAVAGVNDPEMPPLTIEDLGILRAVEAKNSGHGGDTGGQETDSAGEVIVTITPTYSGCPAVEYIEQQIVEAVVAIGVARETVVVKRELAPAWSTDWITETGRAKLAEAGISPPRTSIPGETSVQIGPICCPQCGSANTAEISRFGSTACKALHRCLDCAEPFDHVKEF